MPELLFPAEEFQVEIFPDASSVQIWGILCPGENIPGAAALPALRKCLCGKDSALQVSENPDLFQEQPKLFKSLSLN